jgi:hypothetical protein
MIELFNQLLGTGFYKIFLVQVLTKNIGLLNNLDKINYYLTIVCFQSGLQPQPQILREKVDGLHRRRGLRRHHRALGKHQPRARHSDDQEE